MYIAVAILFAVFAAVQYNDPDYYVWMPAYLLVTVLIILSQRSARQSKGLLMAAIGYGVWMLTYTPDIIHWIENGLLSITGSMQAESPFIEFVREFFGLLLCAVTCLYYWRKSLNK